MEYQIDQYLIQHNIVVTRQILDIHKMVDF